MTFRMSIRKPKVDIFGMAYPTTRTDIARLSILQLTSRGKEMNDCARVVTAQPFLDVANFYLSVVEDRYSSFVKRHGLMKQMVKEDVEGQR